MSEGKSLPSPNAAEPQSGEPRPVPANNKGISVDDDAKTVQFIAANAAPGHSFLRRRRLALGTVGVLALAAALWFGVPWVRFTLGTVSTDDAFVNGHATNGKGWGGAGEQGGGGRSTRGGRKCAGWVKLRGVGAGPEGGGGLVPAAFGFRLGVRGGKGGRAGFVGGQAGWGEGRQGGVRGPGRGENAKGGAGRGQETGELGGGR